MSYEYKVGLGLPSILDSLQSAQIESVAGLMCLTHAPYRGDALQFNKGVKDSIKYPALYSIDYSSIDSNLAVVALLEKPASEIRVGNINTSFLAARPIGSVAMSTNYNETIVSFNEANMPWENTPVIGLTAVESHLCASGLMLAVLAKLLDTKTIGSN